MSWPAWILLAVLLGIVVRLAVRALDKALDEIFPPSSEEMARRLQEQATKDFNRRHRLKRIRALVWW